MKPSSLSMVEFAQQCAALIPSPRECRAAEAQEYRDWEDLMMTAGECIAGRAGFDPEVLRAAVGPRIEVGVNPPWRVLLEIALLAAEQHVDGRCRPDELDALDLSVERVGSRLTAVV